MGWKELQRELSDAFTDNGVICKKIFALYKHEKAYGEFVEIKFKGYSILSHAFLEFYIETLEFASAVWQSKKHLTPSGYADHPVPFS